MKYKEINEIYNMFGAEKVITGIKNPYTVIKYRDPYLGVIVPMLLLIAGLNLMPIASLMNFPKIITVLIPIFFILLSLFIFLSLSYILYFENNTIIFKNKLNKKKIIDINKYPRIYMQYSEIDSYDTATNSPTTSQYYNLHIQQNETDVVLNIEFLGSKKVYLLLDNLQMKNKEDIAIEQWESSATQKEKNFSDYSSFLDQKVQIIGIKDSSLNFKIMNNKNLKLKLLICLFISIFSFILASASRKNLDLSNFFATITGFSFVVEFFLVFLIAEKWKNFNIKVSYPSNSTIKINHKVYDYKKDHVMISLRGISKTESTDKYVYELVIHCNNSITSIPLELPKEDQLKAFIDNLIFSEKPTS